MKRRSFFKLLGLGTTAAIAAPALSAVPEITSGKAPSTFIGGVEVPMRYGEAPRTTVRTGLPKVCWRKLNEGVQPLEFRGMADRYTKGSE